jgi:Flp pilus assembly protein TadD
MLHALFQLLGSHYANDDLGAVEGLLRSILATVPDDPTSMKFLGLVYYRTGRTDEAVRLFDMAARRQRSDASFETQPRDDFLSRHGYSAMAACHLEATRPDGNTARTWYDLGLALGDLGRREEADVAFLLAKSAPRQLPQVWFHANGAAGAPPAGTSTADLEDDD